MNKGETNDLGTGIVQIKRISSVATVIHIILPDNVRVYEKSYIEERDSPTPIIEHQGGDGDFKREPGGQERLKMRKRRS